MRDFRFNEPFPVYCRSCVAVTSANMKLIPYSCNQCGGRCCVVHGRYSAEGRGENYRAELRTSANRCRLLLSEVQTF